MTYVARNIDFARRLMRLFRTKRVQRDLRVILFAVTWVTAIQLDAAEPESPEQQAFRRDTLAGLPSAKPGFAFLGSRSCSAAACHGGIDADPGFKRSRRNEFITWIEDDPHSRAYRTLSSERSIRMLERLGIQRDGEVLDVDGMANCFGCHNPQPLKTQRHLRYYDRDGVACEVCHGPASDWIEQHHLPALGNASQRANWIKAGMVDTKNLATRAELCAACHVGSPGRDVNHDLIAAGHPPLKFELAAYHDLLPKHWRDQRERTAHSYFELQLWAIGQATSGNAALALLRDRAQRAVATPATAVWPEFAEYDCFACHHDVEHPSWRQSPPSSRVGLPVWGSWYFAIAGQLDPDGLSPIADTMQPAFRSDPKAVTNAIVGQPIAIPTNPTERLSLAREMMDGLADQLEMADDAQPLVANWDEATQLYLAIVAWHQSRNDEWNKQGKGNRVELPNVDATITDLRAKLAFPSGYDSPRRLFEPGSSSSRESVTQSLRTLILHLHRREEP